MIRHFIGSRAETRLRAERDAALAQIRDMTDLCNRATDALNDATSRLNARAAVVANLQKRLAETNAVLHEWGAHAENWQREIREAQAQGEQDARQLAAYARWCEENDCVPSKADLERHGA